MKYDDEPWMKTFTRDTPSWVAMSWQARGLALEIARKLPKHTGEISVGRRGLEAIAILLHAKWSEIEPYVLELITEGRLEYDPVRQVIRDPQHVERQNSATSQAERQRRHRESQSRMQVAEARDSSSREVVARDSSSLDVTAGHELSRDVTKEEKERKKEEKDKIGERASAPASQPRQRVEKPKATRLPTDWQVSPELRAWAKAKGISDRDIDAQAERFRDHWHASSTDTSLKVSWDAAYRTWMGRAIEMGHVDTLVLAPVRPQTRPQTPDEARVLSEKQTFLAAAVATMRGNT
jgi:hypothetical protein